MRAVRSYFDAGRRFGLKKSKEFVLLALLLSATLFEGIGLAMLLPIVDAVQAGGNLDGLSQQSLFWSYLASFYSDIGIPITLATLIITSFSCICIRQIFSYARQIYFQSLLHGLIRNIRNMMFGAYLEANSEYHDQEKTGAVINSMTTELTLGVQTLLAPVQVFTYVLMILVYLVILLFITGPVAIAAIAVLGMSALVLRNIISRTQTTGSELANANERMAAFLIQRLGSVRLVRLSHAEGLERREMRYLTDQQRKRYITINTYLARVNVLMEPIALALGFAVLYFGVGLLNLKLSEIAVFAIISLMRLLPAVKELISVGQSALGTQGSLEKLCERHAAMNAAKEVSEGGLKFEKLKSGIEFRSLHFAYPKDRDTRALRAVSLTIPAGKMTAIVGRSGAGKTTLIDLIPRLREPCSGDIFFDSTPYRDFDLQSLRHGISYVPQNPIVFNVSVKEQISYGSAESITGDIESAAKAAGAHDFISRLPNGYDTLIGERGVLLSGGQLQRLDLARALYRETPILILDEPTSNLDAEAETAFRHTLQSLRDQRKITIIVVAHRLATISDADQIVVLNNGNVENIGTHQDILQHNKWYRDAYEKQQPLTAKA
ncbi:MAG: ABC transporter ATP-binding protein [Pseudomonadota bacterium]|nr:ABC transporter ATP-binding protein [Pseudomonadota bacterium]